MVFFEHEFQVRVDLGVQGLLYSITLRKGGCWAVPGGVKVVLDDSEERFPTLLKLSRDAPPAK